MYNVNVNVDAFSSYSLYQENKGTVSDSAQRPRGSRSQVSNQEQVYDDSGGRRTRADGKAVTRNKRALEVVWIAVSVPLPTPIDDSGIRCLQNR